MHSNQIRVYKGRPPSLMVGSQYDATPYIALRRLRVDTRRNATQR